MQDRFRALLAAARRRIDAWTLSVAGRLSPLRDAIRMAPAAAASLGVLGLALSASSSTAPEAAFQPQRIVGVVGADLSDRALERIAAQLDPAALSLAARHDPSLTPAVWGLTPGWDNLSLTGRPPMDALRRAGLEAQRINAQSPIVSGALRPIGAFRFVPNTPQDRVRALRCLTQAIYYEAALEPRRGQEAVAQVILNRVRDRNFPASVCGVVYQGAERVTGCQFSFTCDGSLARQPVAWAWRQAEDVAQQALAGFVAASVGTATHYHADYVHPWWAPTLTKVNQIGAHIFYRWIGAPGDTSAFVQAYSGREPVIDEQRFSRPRLTQIATSAEALEAAGVIEQGRTVVIDGQTRQVGVISLGGRRQPSREEIAEINARMAEFEAAQTPPPPASRTADVPQLDVIEVGRPDDAPAAD